MSKTGKFQLTPLVLVISKNRWQLKKASTANIFRAGAFTSINWDQINNSTKINCDYILYAKNCMLKIQHFSENRKILRAQGADYFHSFLREYI